MQQAKSDRSVLRALPVYDNGDYLVTRHFCNGSELLASSYYKPVPIGFLHGQIWVKSSTNLQLLAGGGGGGYFWAIFEKCGKFPHLKNDQNQEMSL